MSENVTNLSGSTKDVAYNDYATIYCFFRDADDSLVDVTNPKVTITKNNGDYTLVDAADMTKVSGTTGKYSYTINFSDPAYTEGLYQVKFIGVDGSTTLKVNGQIKIGPITAYQGIIRSVRFRLKDFKRRLDTTTELLQYKLDDNTIFKWTENELASFIDNALSDINGSGPTITNYDYTTLPGALNGLLVTVSVVHALDAQAALEIANELDDADEKLKIKRSGPYMQLANALRGSAYQRIKDFKFANRARAISLGTTRLPFRVQRVLGLVPGYGNLFG